MIDFHCHLDLYPNPAAVATQIQDSNTAVLSVTTTPSAFLGTAKLAAGKPMIRTALGLHPELAGQRVHELTLFDALLPGARFVGEVGLDGSSRFAPTRTAQQQVFAHILRSCADNGGRIMSIHSRAAAKAVIDALAAVPASGTPVLHWFTGSTRQVELALDQGCWFSVGAPMLASAKGRELVKSMPLDRVLTETDGPFTTAEGRPATPTDVGRVVPILGELWSISSDDVQAQLYRNLGLLLRSSPWQPTSGRG